MRLTLTTRVAVGYMAATACVFGGMFGYINSAQQIFADIFQVARLFPAIFALIAGAIGLSSLVNSRIVERLGMRIVSHSALFGYIVIAAIHSAAVAYTGYDSLWIFVALQAAMMFCFGMMGANFNALAMEPLGHVAGTASSIQGFVTTTGGAILGFTIGQQFDGSVVPLTAGFFALGVTALIAALITERGKLFRPSPVHAPQPAAEAWRPLPASGRAVPISFNSWVVIFSSARSALAMHIAGIGLGCGPDHKMADGLGNALRASSISFAVAAPQPMRPGRCRRDYRTKNEERSARHGVLRARMETA